MGSLFLYTKVFISPCAFDHKIPQWQKNLLQDLLMLYILKSLPCGCSTSSKTAAPMSMMAKFVRERDLIKFQRPEVNLVLEQRKIAELAVVKEDINDIIEVHEDSVGSELSVAKDEQNDIIEVNEFEEVARTKLLRPRRVLDTDKVILL